MLGEYLLLPPEEDRPVVVDRGHPSWAEVDAEQRERLGDPLVLILNCITIAWPAALVVACVMPRKEDGLGLSTSA